MAELQSVDIQNDIITLTIKIARDEYAQLGQETAELLVLPGTTAKLDDILTTGKLGNSNRIMLPNKILKRHGVTKLPKKVAAKIFDQDKSKFLVIKLRDIKTGVPVFKDETEKE